MTENRTKEEPIQNYLSLGDVKCRVKSASTSKSNAQLFSKADQTNTPIMTENRTKEEPIQNYLSLGDVKCRVKSASTSKSNAQLFLEQIRQLNQELCTQRDFLQTELLYSESASVLLKEEHESMVQATRSLANKCTKSDKNAKEQVENFMTRLKSKFGVEFWNKLQEIESLRQELAYIEAVQTIQNSGEQIELGLTTRDFALVISSYSTIKGIKSDLHPSKCAKLKNFVEKSEKVWRDHLQKLVNDILPEQLAQIGFPFDVVQQIDLKSAEIVLLKDLIFLRQQTSTDKDKESGLLEILLEPFEKRFLFHFYGDKLTNQKDKPEWFYTQILKWIQTNKVIINKFVLPALDENTEIDIKLVDGLCLLAKKKLEDSYGGLMDENTLFSHLIDETVVFEMEIKALGYSENCGCLEVFTEEACLDKWLEMERVCNVEKTDQLLSQKNAWTPRYEHAKELDDFKVPECTDDFLLLLQLITERYRLLKSPLARCRFVDLQKQLLDDFRVRLVQLSRDPSSAWSTPFPQILNSAAYVAYVINEWSDIPFFIQIQAERMKLTGQQKIEGTFEAMSELFTMLQQQMCKIMLDSMVNGEFKPALTPYAKEKWFAMENNLNPCQVTSSFCPYLLEIRERFSFLKVVLSQITFDNLFRRAVSCIENLIDEQIIAQTSFNGSGGAQLLYDATNALVPLLKSYQVKGISLNKVIEKGTVLSLNVGNASLLEDSLNKSKGDDTVLREFGVFSLTKGVIQDLLKQRVDLVHTSSR